MVNCIDGCESSESSAYECSYCGEEHCVNHRLPENHNCRGLKNTNTLGPEFREGRQSLNQRDRDTTIPMASVKRRAGLIKFIAAGAILMLIFVTIALMLPV